MAQETEYLVRSELRSPRSAAIAGIVYALLTSTIMLVTANAVGANPEEVTREWLETWSGTSSLVLALMPFAGIAFLWFTGVIRDRLGAHEDQFFATIFLGSGIMFVLLLFVWGAVLGAMMATTALTTVDLADNDVYLFGCAFMSKIIGDYALRVAGVYMTAIGTLWTRTGIVPRWLTIVTYILALGFLVAASWVREARFIFPAWVFLVSVRILVLNYRRTHDQEGKDGLSMGERPSSSR
jgi:hypothetical protein